MYITEFLERYNTEDVLNAVIIMAYDKSIDKDFLMPASEMLASNALCDFITDSKYNFNLEAYKEMKTVASNILEPKVQQIFENVISHKGDTDAEKEDLLKSLLMQMKNVSFRGDGYMYQLLELSEKFYLPFDYDMKETYGFSYSTCEKVIIAIYNSYIAKLSFISNDDTRVTAIREHAFKVKKSELYAMFDLEEIDSLMNYLSVKIGATKIKSTNLDDFKILYSKPFVDFGDYIYLPLINIALMNMPKLFHYTFIAEKKFSKEVVGRYANNRGNVIEELTSKYLNRLFDEVYLSLKYPASTKEYEADITIQSDNATIFAEAKGKILTLASLQGKLDSMRSDIYDAIGKAYEQSIRSINQIESSGAFIDELNKKEITLKNTPWKFPMCVMAENFVSIPSEIYKYIEIQGQYLLPYAVNIYDLDIITRECLSKEEFINYMIFRQMNLKHLSAMDELDIFGFFKKNGLQKLNCDINEEVWAVDYTQELDVKYNLLNKEWFIEFTKKNLLKNKEL